ncbi:hypothetical protein V1509DRAFT_654166 [Lipomyces kononenkoae]
MSCGLPNKYACPNELCCSSQGWCGNSNDHCLDGCQLDYGNCGSNWVPTVGALQASIGGQCGPGIAICSSGQCCSRAGWCGSTTSHCAAPGCQPGYGTCDADDVPSGRNTSQIRRNRIGNVPYGQAIYSCRDPGHVAMTFDDGPYLYTGDLLDILDEHDVKATFFVTGNNLGKGAIDSETMPWREYITKAYEAGHQIGSHSWSHPNFDALTAWEQRVELYKNEMALVNILGMFPTYFRPPYGFCGALCLATSGELGYHVIIFDLDTKDYLHDSPDTIQQSKDIVKSFFDVRDWTTDHSVSIQHDVHYQTVYNLTEYSIEFIKEMGYEFVTVGECLGDPERNWYRSE